MTLSRKTTLMILSLVAGLGVLSAAMLWGLRGLQRDVHATFDEYRESRLIHEAEVGVALAEALLASESPDYEAVIGRLQVALRQLDSLSDFQGQEQHRHVNPLHEELEVRRASSVTNALRILVERIDDVRMGKTSPMDTAQVVAPLDEVLQGLDHLAKVADAAAANSREAADVKSRSTLTVATMVCVAIILVGLVIGISQYQGIVRPLRQLQEGVRRISSGKFTERISVVGDGEFAGLIEEFNRMAAELDELYRTLESRVVEKSKELVRSERLASVGFLAAGVAHEVNTPLNIISGYAELTLERLRNGIDGSRMDTETLQALQIMRDESFRCKDIIEKLLSLAKPGEDCRQRVSLAHIADEVTTIVSRLKRHHDRRLTLRVGASDPLTVVGSRTELKQVLLNLTVNALEAVKPGAGEVFIDGRCRDGWVELRVTDNGRGMASDTLEHVFEPFFSNRRGSNGSGAGLGLSISHAIVEAHGGRITAESDGPGMGSRFIVQLPAAAENGNHDSSTLQAHERSAGAGR